MGYDEDLRHQHDPSSADFPELLFSPVVIGDHHLSLIEFLRLCASSLESREETAFSTPELLSLRDAFLGGGLARIGAASADCTWIQRGLAISPGRPHHELYRRVAHAARSWLDAARVENFFFMHKPPGLRLRFEVKGPEERSVIEALDEEISRWSEAGLIEGVVPAVYEPEDYLFGGTASMRSVHRLFTADSLAWLEYHALVGQEGESKGPDWAISLVMLRALFNGLGISGWEDIGVWDHVRRRTGRTLSVEARGEPAFEEVAAGIQTGWFSQAALLERLSPCARAIAESAGLSIRREAERWCAEYFCTREAIMGPRAACAFFVIFHWNRGGLSSLRQTLLTEALATREET